MTSKYQETADAIRKYLAWLSDEAWNEAERQAKQRAEWYARKATEERKEYERQHGNVKIFG